MTSSLGSLVTRAVSWHCGYRDAKVTAVKYDVFAGGHSSLRVLASCGVLPGLRWVHEVQ